MSICVAQPPGNVTSRRLRDGTSIGYTYDTLNRLTTKDLPGSDPDVAYGYDLIGELTSAATATQAVTLGYDALGRLTSDAQPQGTMAYRYDLAGRRTRVTWPDAFYVTYDHDATGAMTAVKQSGSTSLATYAYDDQGRRASLTMGNGVVTSYAYDPASRLASLGHAFASPADNLALGFAYNPAGQIASTTRSNDAYAWPDAATSSKAYTANGLNQYSAAGGAVTYDAKGNLTSYGSDAYTYDSENRLTLRTNGSTINTLAYDPLGRLRSYTLPSPTIGFVYDGANIAGAYNGTTMLHRYVLGAGSDEALVDYAVPTGTANYLSTDERGSVIAKSNASGTATGKDSYDEYGRRGSTSNTYSAYGYTGQVDLAPLPLYYYKARMYAPALGRFVQTDPIGYGDGVNWYNYVGSDPINLSDPSGLLYAIPYTTCVGQGNGPVSGEKDDIVVTGQPICTTTWFNYPDFGRPQFKLYDNLFDGGGAGSGAPPQPANACTSEGRRIYPVPNGYHAYDPQGMEMVKNGDKSGRVLDNPNFRRVRDNFKFNIKGIIGNFATILFGSAGGAGAAGAAAVTARDIGLAAIGVGGAASAANDEMNNIENMPRGCQGK